MKPKHLQINLLTEAEYIEGAQFGLVNISGSDYGPSKMNGLQFGAINIASEVKGTQGGLVNLILEGDMKGVQAGAVNVIDGVAKGVQIGLINYTNPLSWNSLEKESKLLQIGLINYNSEGKWYSRCVPLISIRKRKVPKESSIDYLVLDK